MSFATITGVLKDAFGIVIPNQELLFEATKTSETVLNNTSAKVVTDSVGGYSVELNFGTYTLKTKQVREASYKTVASNILVYSTVYTGRDLQYLLLSQTDIQIVDQNLIDQLLNIKVDIYAARDDTILNAQEAVASETNAAASASDALISKNAASSSATSATASKNAAASSATSASSSASSASSSATSATASKNAAASSATAAATSATNAATSAADASTSASNVYAARDETILNAQEAVASKTNAAASATSANSSANAAASSATSASSSASSASSSATSASSSASSASSSATSATASKNAAATSATNAATSATNAATSATNASTSASNAATSATLAGNFAASLNAVVPYAPSVNPTLDLDFAKQKYRWYAGAAGITESNSMTPLITFSRSSTATYFDAMGVMRQAANDTPRIDYDPATGECKGLLIEEARTNLLTYSNKFHITSWARTSTIAITRPFEGVAPDGTLTATKFFGTSGNASLSTPSLSCSSSTMYQLSFYAKAGGYTTLATREAVVSGNTATFDLSAGTSTGNSSITSVGNGWYKCVFYYTTGSSQTTQQYNVIYNLVGDGASGVYIWGAQLEVGAFQTSYIPSSDTWSARASTATYLDSSGVLQTAASGVARSAAYDYDADGVLRPIGLLLERAATNLLLYSEQFDNAAWNKSACSVTANATTAPDGNTTADKIVEDTTTAMHWPSQSAAISPSTAYTYSFYAKAAERTFTRVRLSDGPTTYEAYINLSTGEVGSYTAGLSVYTKKAANGFYHCCITVTTGASATALSCGVALATAYGTYSYLGDGTSGIYVWGAQLETGPYATSYIPTTSAQVTRVADTSTSAQVTRAADSAVIGGANFSQWYKQYEGTIVGEASNDSPTLAGHGFAVLSDGSDTNRIRIGSSTNFFVVTKDSTEIANFSVGTRGEYSYKLGCSFSKGSCIGGYQGNTSSVTASNIPVLNKLGIGVNSALVGLLNGHIRSLKYFPKALLSAELQAMTA